MNGDFPAFDPIHGILTFDKGQFFGARLCMWCDDLDAPGKTRLCSGEEADVTEHLY